jgi:hypothetical protein
METRFELELGERFSLESEIYSADKYNKSSQSRSRRHNIEIESVQGSAFEESVDIEIEMSNGDSIKFESDGTRSTITINGEDYDVGWESDYDFWNDALLLDEKWNPMLIETIMDFYSDPIKTVSKTLHVVVMDFNAVTVTSYVIEKEEFREIATDIDADDDDDVVIEFIDRQGHRQSEIHYMFSEDEIEFN